MAIISSAALLVAQQVAFRLLAPVIGSSVETWSAIIGVFLLGIAVGNHVAGRLADRISPVLCISGGLLSGAASVFVMPLIADLMTNSTWFNSLSLTIQIFSASFLVCFLPGTLLSLVTPPSIRSVVTSSAEVGSVAGRIFAWGTFGSLAGNYLAGFVLLALLGVRTIVDLTSATLLILAIITWMGGRRWGSVSIHAETSRPADAESIAFAGFSVAGFSVAGSPVAGSPVAGSPVADARVAQRSAWFWQAVLIVSACSFVTGALEGAAFRILAPLVGVSMFLSAGVVGMILAGMSLGNALGGSLASRFGSQQSLRWSLLASGVATLAVAPSGNLRSAVLSSISCL